MSEIILTELIKMSRSLGDPNLDYVILGEGNTSARIDEETFFIKASGTALGTLQATDVVLVSFGRVFELLGNHSMSDADILAGLNAAKIDPTVEAVPSVETFLHAMLYQLDGINFIGHTHPTAINAILCSQFAAEAYSGALFPDQIVYCGPAPVFVPYTDPGLPLAHAVWEATKTYCDVWGEVPKMIVMQNHGFIALGGSSEEVQNITRMSVKAAQVIAGTYAMGGPHFLSHEAVNRIHTRPDEHYRIAMWRKR